MSALREGEYVVDTTRNLVGRLVCMDQQTVTLAPLDGGDEWEAPASLVRRARTGEELLAKVRVYNERNRPEW